LAQSEVPALIPLDVKMPGIDGYETCRQLKILASTAEIPVIFVSGHDQISDRLKGYIKYC
jgi:CheY-like chemotaxis protein